MKAILVGPDRDGLGDALEAEGVELTRIDAVANRPALEEAGVTEADALVLTETEGATAISVAKDINDDLRVVVYTADDLPDFARGQADFIVDPQLLSADAVAEELAA
ncbi:CTP synthetase [Halorussus gelatinilyticus]|uniref:CTP synthetase n=1 Tax=Halorussus gelatinilyticus TaxID=2937524 RepID=A0A8U0IKG0_9EURY|nr:CTP synthetase [Halorussus gelatinilyticus]UPW01155.1 CTP synthetase [Halorussus gelatinilyticus]